MNGLLEPIYSIFLFHRHLPAKLLWGKIRQLNISLSLSVIFTDMFPRTFWMSLELIFLSFEKLGLEPRKIFKNYSTEGYTRWLQNSTCHPSSNRITSLNSYLHMKLPSQEWRKSSERRQERGRWYTTLSLTPRNSMERDASHLRTDRKLNTVFRIGISYWTKPMTTRPHGHGSNFESVSVSCQGNTSPLKPLLAQLKENPIILEFSA